MDFPSGGSASIDLAGAEGGCYLCGRERDQ